MLHQVSSTRAADRITRQLSPTNDKAGNIITRTDNGYRSERFFHPLARPPHLLHDVPGLPATVSTTMEDRLLYVCGGCCLVRQLGGVPGDMLEDGPACPDDTCILCEICDSIVHVTTVGSVCLNIL